jgi:hypothetical protein
MFRGGLMKDGSRIGIRELKNRTSRVVDEVHEREQEYVVTKTNARSGQRAGRQPSRS